MSVHVSEECELNRLSVVVPCFNERDSVEALLRKVRSELPPAEIVIVDDASTDGSADAVAGLVDELRLTLIRHEQNGGKGAAVRTGLEAVTGDWFVIQDADLEYEPSDLPEMLNAAQSCPDAAVYGSRYLQQGRARGGAVLNYLAVRILAVLTWLLYGRWLTDPHTCYKLLPTTLGRALQLRSHGFELCAEINSRLLAGGIDILEVPIHYHPRSHAEGKKIRLKDFFTTVWTYLTCRLTASTSLLTTPSSQTSGSTVRAVFYPTSRLVIAMFLLLAGASKLAPARAIALTSWFVLPSWAVGSCGVMEFLLGCAVLTLVPHRLLHRIVLLLYSLFVVVLVVQWGDGEEVCQCLGSLSLPIGWMLAADVLLLASLVIFRRHWERPVPQPSSRIVREQLTNCRIVAPACLLISVAWFGSLDSAYGFVTGQPVLVDTQTRFAGTVRQSESVDVVYQLSNSSSQPLRITGAKTTCSCMGILDLPTTLAPGQSRDIRLRVSGRTVNRLQRESAELLFDDSTLRLTLNVTVIVRPNQSSL